MLVFQFYLADGLLKVGTINETQWPLNDRKYDLGWAEVDGLGNWDSPENISSHQYIVTTPGDKFVMLKLRLETSNYDGLHNRVLEVSEITLKLLKKRG